MRWWSLALGILLLAPGALAHGDIAGFDGDISLPAEEQMEIPREIHWHRVVGSITADDPDAMLEFVVQTPTGETLLAGPGSDLALNHLVDCCIEETWADATFILRNVGTARAEVDVDFVLLHDNLYVVVDGAEGGAAWQTILITFLIAAVPAVVSMRPAQSDVGKARRWTAIGGTAQAAAWVVALATSVTGMIMYGGGPLVGSLAATAPIPSDLGVLNTHSVLMLAVMALWATGAAGWAVVRRRSPDPHAAGAPRMAAALLAGCVVMALLVAVELGAPGLAVLGAGLTATPIAAREFVARRERVAVEAA